MGASQHTARVLVTGPIESAADYVRAARESGWEPIEFALLAVDHESVDVAHIARQRFDWIAITSSNAIEFLAQALQAAPDVTCIPCAVVGTRTAERVQALGFELGMPAATDARSLATALAAAAPRGARVLWPRGSLSDELARHLRERGLSVVDPVVYSTRSLATSARAPQADAVFFASPSAVRAWFSRADSGAESSARTAIAIGPTTFEALLAETGATFFDTISLPEPTPEAFGLVLQHLDRATPP